MMAIFEKIGEFTKSVGDKAGTKYEIMKINSKINSEGTVISGLHQTIGSLCWDKYNQGERFGQEIDELLEQIKGHHDAIAALNAEINEIVRKEEEAARRKEEAANNAGAQQQAEFKTCQGCGAANPAGTRFCGNCGKKFDDSVVICPGCAVESAPGNNFCCNCGHAL